MRSPVLSVRLVVLVLAGVLGGCAHWQLIDDGEVNEAALRRMEQEVAEARGLAFARPVNAAVLGKAEVKAYFERRLSGFDDWYDAETKVAHKLGVLPSDVHLRDLYAGSYARNAAALYEREGEGRMLLFPDAFPSLVRAPLAALNVLTATDWLNALVVSHELVHALQDQHFDLGRVLPGALYAENEDMALARKSVVESEANLVSYAYVFRMDLHSYVQRNLLVDYLLATSWLSVGSALLANRDSPSFYTKVMTLQYFHGMRFLQATANAGGGYEAVTRAYLTRLPESTEQLLNPEKLAGERYDPPLQLPSLDDAALPGWTKLDENTFGELSLRTLLELFVSGEEAAHAADGWGGDRYDVYERDERVLLAWRLLWDSDEDAAEFQESYERVLREKYPRRLARRARAVNGWQLYRVSPSALGQSVRLPGVPTAKEELVALRREGRRVVVVEGLDPRTWSADAEAVWAASRAAVSRPRDEPTLVDLPVPPRAVRPDRGLERSLFLAHHDMELRFGVGAEFDDGDLWLSRTSYVRWGMRPHLELSLPLALTLELPWGPTSTLVSVGVPGLLFDVGLVGVSVAEAWRPLPFVALTVQARAQADVPGLVTRPRAVLATSGAVHLRLFDLATLAGGVGFVREGSPLDEEPTDRVTLGSVTTRGFAEVPLVELRLFEGVHLWTTARVELDARTLVVAEQRYALGLSLYF